MLVVYSNREEQLIQTPTPVIDLEEVSRQAGIIERENQKLETIDLPKEKVDAIQKHLNELHNQKFGKTEQLVSEPEPIETLQKTEEIIEEPTEIKIEEVIEEPQEEIVVENQTVEELKDKLAEDSGIKRLTYTKRNA